MVDSKENYKFDLGVEGLRRPVINQTYHLKRANRSDKNKEKYQFGDH